MTDADARRRWSPSRLAAATVLAAWAGLFWFLLLSGRTALYLSDRTAWVVPTGGVILTLAALGRLVTARATGPRSLDRRGAWQAAVAIVPVAAILALPPSTLGSFAAARRSVATGFVAPDVADGGAVTLASVAAAGWSEDARRSLVRRAGSTVRFDGFVARREGQPADEFFLTRFLVSCCVADALSVQVRVVGAPPGRLAPDDWVRVTGTFYPVGREVVVDASRIEPIPQPEDPYLNV